MPEAWDLIPDAERTAEETTTFILFCEDSINEPSYFRSFQIPQKVKINVVEDQRSSFKNIISTLHYCEKEGLLESDNKGYKIKPGITNDIWCVYDRDVETDDFEKIDPERDVDFTFGIQSAEAAGLNVAWSNDVFELWILLHFEDVTPKIWQHRKYVYERLTSIFKEMPDQSPEMSAITGKENFNYKIFLKRKAYFNLYVLPYLSANLNDAISRALALEAAFPVEHKHHQCNPCTKIHHLVRSILSVK